MNKEDSITAGRIRELAERCYHRDIPVYSDFLNLNEQSAAWQLLIQLPPVSVKAIGGFDIYGNEISMCERKMLCFLPKDREADCRPPIELLGITPASRRFAEVLSHRDFLGALLNLGLERRMIGDIFVTEEKGYCFCHQKISAFICDNLTRIKHTTVLAAPDIMQVEAAVRTVSVSGTLSSVRLDSMLSLCFNISRSAVLPLIEEGRTFVNGKMITRSSYHPKPEDIISVRGMGKFKFTGCTGVSKKGRTVIRLEKYV